jgi:O-phospho-L-seryl-tRNASec:L-selenocysteinyl-tRNA synthase
MVKLTKAMMLHVLRKVVGLAFVNDLVVLPFATGMAITLSLLALKSLKPDAEYVLWPRIDQKTCLKSILTANLKPIWIEPILEGDELRTDIAKLEKLLQEFPKEKVLCVFSTTSCFAPRAYDRVVDIA